MSWAEALSNTRLLENLQGMTLHIDFWVSFELIQWHLRMANKSSKKLGELSDRNLPFDSLNIMRHWIWVSSGLPEFIKYFQQHKSRREMTEIKLMVADENGGEIQENEVKRTELVDVVRSHLLDYQGPT